MTGRDTAAAHLENVEVRFGERCAFAGSLTVAPGERVALIGPSGAGKSTLLRVCTAAVSPSAGTVRIAGKNLAELSGRQLRAARAGIGTVHQGLHLVEPLSALQNVLAGNLGRWGSVRALTSLAFPREREVAESAMRELGIAHLASRRTGLLSGGEQQRVALARILVQRPDLILADEPIAALDPARAREVMAILTRVVDSTGAALIVSLHDPKVATECADRVVGLRAGNIEFDLPAVDVDAERTGALYRIDA
ncbi:phosphonate ABC transporter ATP-binding protein [Dermabacter sp. HSID17554]|uniref:phosphonate ABC transporter ATP-binding protein n=1 Tax=Dermabacter sp. HSID17554 TaxID=2419511 RepID=UPI000F862311|nr:ATP-binding cassette domain-containing protein [Dermabacter sp. HSID17554]RUP86463.1 ATP-binding cassette domain-containing protein [Dermabacter sp. HSID17554]